MMSGFHKGVFVFLFAGVSMLTAEECECPPQDTLPKDTLGWDGSLASNFHMSEHAHDNWTEGGDDLTTWHGSVDGFLSKNWHKMAWENKVKVEYGRTKINGEPSRKSLDQLFAETLYKYKVGYDVNPYASVRLQTQFYEGFEYLEDGSRKLISNFMDPGYLTESVGIGFAPNSIFKTRLGFAYKQTFSEEHGWADDPDTEAEVETFKNEPGLESITEIQFSWRKYFRYSTTVSLFANFKGKEETDAKWENTLSAQMGKYMTADFSYIAMYDYDLSKDTQQKRGISLGLTWKMF